MKKPLLIVGGILLLALLGVIIWFGFVRQAWFETGDPQYFTTTLKEVPLQGVATWKIGERNLDPGADCPKKIFNSYTEGDVLTLRSSTTCGGENGIKVTGTFPKGTLEVMCDVKASSDALDVFSYCRTTPKEIGAHANLNSGIPGEANSRPQHSLSEKIIIQTNNTKLDVWLWQNVNSRYGYAEGTATLKFTPYVPPIAPDPLPPPASGWAKFLSFLSSIIKSFLSLFTSQSIVGNVSVALGSTQTYNINLVVPAPDSEFSDGFGQVQYASYVLSDSSNNIIKEGAWERIYGSYQKAVTLTVPLDSNKDYVLVGVITQMNGTYNYNTGQWSWTEETPIIHEEINIKTKYSVISPIIPPSGGWAKFTAFLNAIIDWFRNIFN